MLLMLKMSAGNVRFFLKSQLPHNFCCSQSQPWNSQGEFWEGENYRRKIEPKGNWSVNLYWFHCMTISSTYDLCLITVWSKFAEIKICHRKRIPLSLPSFSLRTHNIALGVKSLWWLHICLASKPDYTNEKKFDWKPLNTRTWLLAQEEPDLQIAGMVGRKITLAASGSFPCATAVLCQSCFP